MNITLTNEDFTKIDSMIQDMPFKYAYPLFQFFTTKINLEKSRQSLESVAKSEEKNT